MALNDHLELMSGFIILVINGTLLDWFQELTEAILIKVKATVA